MFEKHGQEAKQRRLRHYRERFQDGSRRVFYVRI